MLNNTTILTIFDQFITFFSIKVLKFNTKIEKNVINLFSVILIKEDKERISQKIDFF